MDRCVLRKVFTTIIIRDLNKNRLLLGFKKRDFGMNKWTGLGGKCKENETLLECAKR